MSTLSPAAGELTSRVTIQSIATSPVDDSGDTTHTWGTFATRWAKIEPLKGGENWRASTVDPSAEYKVTLHYTAGVTEAMRLDLGSSRYLYITSVQNTDERGRTTVLMCREEK